jgi:hypothetical protein
MEGRGVSRSRGNQVREGDDKGFGMEQREEPGMNKTEHGPGSMGQR